MDILTVLDIGNGLLILSLAIACAVDYFKGRRAIYKRDNK